MSPLLDDLTLPETLMAFLHTDDGQVRQSVRPVHLTAAAELGELALDGHVDIEDDGSVTLLESEHAPSRPWVEVALAELSEHPTTVERWVRGRRDAVQVQQRAALERGVLSKDRGRFLGFIGYDRHLVAPQLREDLLGDLEAPGAEEVPRAAALAALLTTPAMRRALRFDGDRVERLTALASTAEDAVDPGPMFRTMDYAIATAVAGVVLGGSGD
ncbi:GPP34 family phosphoprotein [Phycicoccus sp. BSK3Z-2]|uniref:GPP34 family phosphoprotein n=1 Tax=Phycicoccus avicenniae TaxID=2828860 RepID=A0A941D6R9_9MICO|nr:GPP34 family phosphoprotein [Phycicoccus avicenniae]MBR7742496.1 GPP34 family phosphoprotein [Phycicoccus avicenniae]